MFRTYGHPPQLTRSLSLLITPAAAARMLTERLWTMTLLASLFGGTGALAGLYVSNAYDLVL